MAASAIPAQPAPPQFTPLHITVNGSGAVNASPILTNDNVNLFWPKDKALLLNPESRAWSLIASSLIPVRTYNLKHFASDLFFPTLINRALKVDNLFARFISILAAFIWDIATMAIRFVACPVRLIYTHFIRDEVHPIAQNIPHGINNPRIQDGFIFVVVTKESIAWVNSSTVLVHRSEETHYISVIDQNSPSAGTKVHERRLDERFMHTSVDGESEWNYALALPVRGFERLPEVGHRRFLLPHQQ